MIGVAKDLNDKAPSFALFFQYAMNVRISNTFRINKHGHPGLYRPLKISKIKSSSGENCNLSRLMSGFIRDGMWDPQDFWGQKWQRTDQIAAVNGPLSRQY